MHIPRLHVVNPSAFARRAAVLAVFVGVATLGLRAEQPMVATSQPIVPFTSYLNDSSFTAPFTLTTAATTDSDLGYSSSTGAAETAAAASFLTTGASSTQPPPRRRYGRPRYSDGSHNPDGSTKYTFVAGIGFTNPTGPTHKYDKVSYGFQVGAGRNFNKNLSLIAQFDWDNFALQGSTLNNQANIYSYYTDPSGLDGSAHAWSFTVNPVYNIWVSDGLGAYLVGGIGYYHKVTSFTVPTQGTYCDYYCYSYAANAVLDHYSSNAPGFNGGIGFTFKPSRFANEKFFVEARYVYILNEQRSGISNVSQVASNPNQAAVNARYNFYPANSNRTSYVPIKFGIRF